MTAPLDVKRFNATLLAILAVAVGGCRQDATPAPTGSASPDVVVQRAALTSAPLSRNGWVATASSSASGEVPAKALDGNASTRWSSGVAQASGQWFQVDMLAPQTFDRITFDAGTSAGDYARAFQVFVSPDGATWGLPAASGSGTGPLVTASFSPRTARYLRVVLTGGAQKWWSIHELNVYGYGTVIPGILPKTGWIASASSASGADTAARAIDGNLGTRWTSGLPQASGQWFTVDMVTSQTFTDVALDADGFSGDYPRAFQIFVSSDGATWGSPVFTGAGTTARVTASFAPKQGRYLKVVLTGSTSKWWSIAELTVSNATGAVLAPALSRAGWKATAFLTCQQDVPANTLDGNVGTRWSSGVPQQPGQWFQLDMSAPQVVSRVSIDAGGSSGDFPRAYQVTVSNDGATWSAPVATGVGTGPIVTIAFDARLTRYLRITQTGSSSSWWSIHELNVYGSLIDGTGTNEVAVMRKLDEQLTAAEALYLARYRAHTALAATLAQSGLDTDLAPAQAARRLQDDALAEVRRWQAELDADVTRVLAYSNVGSPVSIMQGGLVAFLGELRKKAGLWKPSRRADPSCSDVIANQLVYAVAEALLRDDRPAYGLALGRLEEAVQCTTHTDALYFASYMSTAIEGAIARFPSAARPATRKALQEALLNLFVLLHDDTKFSGPSSLYDWLRAHRAELGLAFGDPSSIPRTAGFWLRDPGGSRLVQIREFCETEAPGPYCVAGAHLLDALTDPNRLGLGTCSALEMVSTGFDSALGYDCDKSLCGEQPAEGSGFASGFGKPGLDYLTKLGSTSQFGASLSGLQARLCAAGRRNRPGGGGAGALGAAGDFFLCIAAANASPGQKSLACFNDVLRKNAAAGPVYNGGGWAHDSCGSATADAPSAATADEQAKLDEAKKKEKEKLAKEEERKKVADAAKKEGYDSTKVDNNLKNSGPSIDTAKIISDQEFAAKGCGPASGCTIETQTSTGSDFQIYLKESSVKDATVETIRGLLEHEVLHEALAKSDPTSTEAREHSVICGRLGQRGCMCGPDAGNCGDCSPLAAQGKAFFQCLPQNTVPPPASPLDPLINPTDSETTSAWAACFAELDHGLLDPVSAACAALDCPDGQVAVATAGGGCKCSVNSSNNEPVRLLNSCMQRIHCGDDASQSYAVAGSLGYCGCAPRGSGLVSEAPVIP